MRRRVITRGRIVLVVVAGVVGYLLGGSKLTALHNADGDLSASQTVALRFPLEWNDATPAAMPVAPPMPSAVKSPMVLGSAQFALWNPQPMIQQSSAPRAVVQMASAEETAVPREADAAPPARSPSAVMRAVREAKTIAATAVHRHPERQGFVLNDAQIASIKERLHLTPDQEQMWPAVEAALRNLAYASMREARRRGVAASTAQIAAADPDSAPVQDLKSAAIPLIMSFNSEQKDEVRSLAHVMGLDQLASQF